MRDGILENLPSTLPDEGKVLVVANESGTPGFNGVKSYIEKLNREEEWIMVRCRSKMTDSQVPNGISVVLCAFTTPPGVLSVLRRVAKNRGICCPNHALTIGEVKEVIGVLDQRRQKRDGSIKDSPKSSANGKSTGKFAAPDPIVRNEDVAVQPSDDVIATETISPDSAPDVRSCVCSEVQEDNCAVIDSDTVLSTLSAFNGSCKQLETLVYALFDQYEKMRLGYEESKKQLQEQELASLVTLRQENQQLSESNKKLLAEVERLGKILAGVESVMQSGRST